MEALKLTQVEQGVVATFVGAYKTMDKSSNGVFSICKDFFERNKDSKTKVVRKALTKEMSALIANEDSHIKARLTKVIDVASKFLGYKLDPTDMYFNRIEAITTLLHFFSENEGETIQSFATVKARIETVISGVFDSKGSYNEALSLEIASIKVDNKIEDGEEIVFKGTIDDFIKLALAYSEEDRAKLMRALQAKG